MTASVQQPAISRNGTGIRETEQTPIRCLVVDDHPAILAGGRACSHPSPTSTSSAPSTAPRPPPRPPSRCGSTSPSSTISYRDTPGCGSAASSSGSRSRRRFSSTRPSRTTCWPRRCVVAEADGLLSKSALGSDLYVAIRRAATGMSRLPPVPSTLADGLRRRFDSLEQAIFGLLLAGIPRDEIGRTLHIDTGELETRQWAMLRKLERSD